MYEKRDRIGGGYSGMAFPTSNSREQVLDRRINLLGSEGIVFTTNAHVGVQIPAQALRQSYHAVLLRWCSRPSDLAVPGRHLKGIHFAVDFLTQQNRRVAGLQTDPSQDILATGKRVIILGGGDTGADCLGTCHRQKATSVQQLEILPQPPLERAASTPWPMWPLQLRTESSHEEGGVRTWASATTHFEGDANGHVAQLCGVHVGPPPDFTLTEGSAFSLENRPGADRDGVHGPAEIRTSGRAWCGP